MGNDPLEKRVAELRRRLTWAERERALYLGAPLTVFPALAFLPVVALLILSPRFAHARPLGIVLVPLILMCVGSGILRLARCLQHDFDIISFMAGGTLVVLFVILIVSGVFLATVLWM